ncbi:hypothetical protein EPUS_06885 [Endocarpon pusillum Z07020]|uniref:Uncharacterized protein n=1 Tax=Endocarpon pusillum (strain Z07020 / HMAS-L-300199) TaxID=1263415 RepID=U1GH54_ENDPU|nr:uncharacterized protein EPUS_06885 [Endocarpon pusillum Z07020]ERF77017.1 hypothetical protein EPUS_06885 [Endocarpon pusillum Z07020]
MADTYRPEYRRDYDEPGREKDRGRRQGDPSWADAGSRDRRLTSPQALQRSRSPYRAGSKQDLPSRVTHPASPSSLDSRRTASAEPRSPFPSTISTHMDAEPVFDPRTTTPWPPTAKSDTRDPRLLNRLSTSHVATKSNIPGPSIIESPSTLSSLMDGTNDRSKHTAKASGAQTTRKGLPFQPENLSSTPGTAAEHWVDPATHLVTLLSSLLENASTSAALKHEHNKIKARASHQANLERKVGDLSKTFPAFAETSSKAKKDTEKELSLLDQKLAEHQKTQCDILSAVPEILQTSRTPTRAEKEREQVDLVKRCLSVHEEFKSNVDDLRQRFENHKSVSSNMDEAHQSMDSRINASGVEAKNISLRIDSIQVQCCQLDTKQNELRDDVKSFSNETRSSLAAMKIDLKQCSEQNQQLNVATDTTRDAVDNLTKRLGLLESQSHRSSELDASHLSRTKELETRAEDHDVHFQEIRAAASHKENLEDEVNLMRSQIQELRQELLDAKNQSSSHGVEELLAMKTDLVALKAESLELKNNMTELQSPGQAGQKFFPTNAVKISPNGNDDISSETEARLKDLENQLKNCLPVIIDIQQRLLAKQKEEDARDELVAAQVDDVRASTVKAQEEIRQRIGDLERDVQKQRAEDLEKTQKLNEPFSQLHKPGNQMSTPGISPPSAPPTPQLHRLPQPQAQSTSPQPLFQAFPVEMNRRLDSMESLLSVTGQQLHAVHMAYQQLDHRYTNLTTEPIVRAMVHQMQVMYPFAAVAQQEITNLKQMVEPLNNALVQLDTLRQLVDKHSARLASIEPRIEALEKEKTKNDARHDKLIEHVKEERAKLVDEVKIQKETVDGLGHRLNRLEEYRNAEPDKLEYLTETLAKKWEEQTTKKVEGLTKRLDVLESDSNRQSLLDTFTKKLPASKTIDHIKELQAVHDDDSDDSSTPLVRKSSVVKLKVPPSSAPPAEKGKPSLKAKTTANRSGRKRKRFGVPENNDCSDDDTYTPAAHHSSPISRKFGRTRSD